MEVEELVPMTPEEFRAELRGRGWNEVLLAKRWGLQKRRIFQIIADDDRPRYYDDALRALPMVIQV